MNILYIAVLFLTLNISCGVKGRPLPPLTPREIGYGRPAYLEANKELLKSDSEETSQRKNKRDKN